VELISSRPRAERTSAVLESIESLRFEATTFASTVEIWKEGAGDSADSPELDSPDCESEASSFVAVEDELALPPSSLAASSLVVSALESESESALVAAVDSEVDPVLSVVSPSESEGEVDALNNVC